jgi:hypothetical protein
VALEVDTKPVERILEEFTNASAHVGPTIERVLDRERPQFDCDCLSGGPDSAVPRTSPGKVERSELEAAYVRYAQIVSGQRRPDGLAWQVVTEDPSGLERYVDGYLPHEILRWGGDIFDMFPETCKGLKEQQLSLDEFVPWWFQKARPGDDSYDFFLVKIDRFLEFVAERAPMLHTLAAGEAAILRAAYADASCGGRSVTESCR